MILLERDAAEGLGSCDKDSEIDFQELAVEIGSSFRFLGC